ncbi:bridge-like lipid transfer protein family member 1 isoform X2 [Condylostylus longicornis]|uniref:bridge-like lipid transfer protein family member 1 isoform X2 n=1 Tax=Condylostylus longicornis TaxID=2530218 RepID=UPI00244E3254|nr:bridge-like lipid transfer protein family member 1 isoform X2 [Condylostylus longicornis]
MLFSLFACLSWVIYIIFYNSRVIGLIISKLLNKWFIKGAYFKIGSLSLNPLAGKIMFRDIVYINFDYSIRIQDGYIIFRWWRSYVPKNVSEDLSHSDTRLSVQLNGFEIHTYNRSNLYNLLEKTFGLPSAILMPTENFSSEEKAKIEEVMLNMENTRKSSNQNKKKKRPEAMTATTWRDLIPVIKIDICSGRFVFGNRLTPTTLSISIEEAHCTYSTKPAVCRLDHFMHFVKAKIENAKVMFAPSPKYTGLVDEPPRYMGEGFVVMMSNIVELYFYMDEAGVVPEEPILLTLANGDVVEPDPPVWGLDIKCGKGTDFSYGPWADRQRDHLFKFFFPSDWQKMKPTPMPKAGELRMYQSFDITLCTLNEATIDILFSKDKETNAMHVTIGPGSYVEVTIPWVTQNNGYTTAVAGQLLHAEATTSLQYRSLAEFESLEYKVKIHYPCKWNDAQDWIVNLTGCKATAFLVYKHKSFFQDLIEDWSSKARPDILTFVPYVCKFTILLKDFELITLSNEYNWIDCSSTNQENNHIAFCGDLFDLSFSLPFDDFLPEKVPIKFWIHGEGLDLKLYLPEVSTSRPIVIAIDQNCKILTRSGKIKKRSDLYPRKWQRVCQRSVGWVDFWSAPIVAISILYVYHPMPPVGPQAQADITTPEKEEILLSPIRIPKLKKSPVMNWAMNESFKFDPTTLPADEVTVEIEIGPSVLLAYGSVLRNFIHLKVHCAVDFFLFYMKNYLVYLQENIFGDDQNFSDMEQSNSNFKASIGMEYNNKDISILKDGQNKNPVPNVIGPDEKQKCFDPRYYRPLEVVVSLTIHDIQAHLVKNCTETDPPCPVILIERLGFEMKKRYTETELQVLVSPSYLISLDNIIRSNQEKHIKQGHIMMSALQIRGHAMFSNEGRSLDDETLEYAWLLEIQLGKIQAKLTAAQLLQVISGLETFILLTVDPENCVKSPKNEQLCYHGNLNKSCPKIKGITKYKCPSSEEIKYKMTRVSIDAIDMYLIEGGTALHTWISPVRLSMCNLHGQKVKLGVTGLLPYVLIRLFLQNNKNYSHNYNGRKSSKPINIYDLGEEELNSTEFKRKRDSSLRNNIKNKENLTKNLKDDISDKNINLEDAHQIFNQDHWIEVGYSSFGPILFEGASALPFPDHKLHELQHNFLKEHDQRLKKLWFLWNGFNGSKSNSMRCGCIGGCAFFGTNRNGSKFFKPSSQDIRDNINIAKFHILNKSKEVGFGESILHKGKLVFHTPPYSLRPVILCDNNETYNLEILHDQKYSLSEIDPHKKAVHINSKRNRESSVPPATSTVKYNSVINNAVKQNQYEVPYSRLLESPSKKITRKDWQTSTSHSTLATKTPESIQYSVPKTSASDSRLTCEIDFSEDLEVPNIMSHSAPQTNPLHFETTQLNVNSGEEYEKTNAPFTASITSDCPSEIFFSAEEDIQSNFQAGSNTFNSPIEPFSNNMYSHRPYYATCKSDTEFKRRDSKHNYNRISGSNIELINTHAGNSSESPSFSTNSFISAMSSQEDVALSNSHIQMNRSIFESQLLMESYLNHLALLTCNNWSTCSFPFGADALSLPLYHENENGELAYIGAKMFPKFELLNNWKEIKMLPKVDLNYDNAYQQNMNEGLKPHPWDPSVMLSKTNEDCDGEDSEFLDFQSESVASCVSIVMRMKGQCNVLMTPLLLEGIQRIIETVIPSLSSMHPLTVINSMHYSCMNRVQNDNILKSDESLSHWSQINSNQKGTENVQQTPRDSVLSDVYKESITSKIQGLFIIPKVSVNMLQASVVSERTSLTKLDNIQELSCVSLLAFYIQGISAKFHLAKTNKASMQNIYIQKTIKSENQTKKSGIMRGTKAFLAQLSSQARPDNIAGEPILIETSEKQLEELVIALDVASTHIQLRRLKNESNKSQSSQAIITAIPEYKSKTSFSCVKMPDNQDDDIGFIMFECGLERLSVKMIKKSHYEKSENSNEHVNMSDKSNQKNYNSQNPNANESLETDNSNISLKPEFAWRILQKKPPTPKTPKERITHALEHIIVMGEDDNKIKQSNKAANDADPESDELKDVSTESEKPHANGNQNDKTSSCIIELKSIWFNFAAPPCVPITRKIDFTRLDWNLLSTASPAITAWMNPCNRLTMKIISLSRSVHTRYTAITACLMADALDNDKFQRKQKIKKSRYPNMYTLLSKTLQEDPSCQLCTIMQKFMLDEGAKNFESNFKQSDIPHLNVLRQGVIVLCRQWKNMLYNPILFEHQYKNKLFRSDVPLAFEQIDEENEDGECDGDVENIEPIIPVEILEETENTLLLGNERLKFGTPEPGKTSTETLTSPNLHGLRRNIQMIPIISGLVDKQHAEIEYGALQDDSTSSLNSLNKILYAENQKEDIYTWMAKQQENFHKKEFIHHPPVRKATNALQSHEYKQDSIKLLDAHLIFEPLLTCLGVMPQQMLNKVNATDISTLENFGTNVSLIGTFDSIRVDIVVSELGENQSKSKNGGKKSCKKSIIMDAPSFLCEKVGIDLEVFKISDGKIDQSKPYIYISRRQLKKHASTIVNFSLNIRFISQQVNMPLLRLLNQISNMYQNVKDAQNKFHEQPELAIYRKNNIKTDINIGNDGDVYEIPYYMTVPPDNTRIFGNDKVYDSSIFTRINNKSMQQPRSFLSQHHHHTPSPQVKPRPQSFAQKLRSTGKSVKGKLGYTNLNESKISPLQEHPENYNNSKLSLESRGFNADHVPIHNTNITTGIIYQPVEIPNCWKTIYHLLELYGSMPETKRIHRPSFSTDAVESTKNQKIQTKPNNKMDEESSSVNAPVSKKNQLPEKTRIAIFGVAKIHKTRLLATLSGLKLEAEITTFNSSFTWRKKTRPISSLECSLTGQVGRAMIVLLEGVTPNQQTVVKIIIGKSQTLYSSVTKKGKDKNSGLLSVGPVNIDIPQHPVALHGMMTRSSKQLSSTLQELRVGRNSSRASHKGTEDPESPFRAPDTKEKNQQKGFYQVSKSASNQNTLLQPLVMQFNILLQSLSINAALLPSLQAQYKMNHVNSNGVTGSKAKFSIDLPTHTLSFSTKIQSLEANLPAEACIALPPIHVVAEYIPENQSEDMEIDGIVLRKGSYVNAQCEIGEFERCLTTDLLNHLVFVQKVFMKEVNEVIQKVYGGEKPVPIWLEDSHSYQVSSVKRILFSLNISMKRIQLTATTPCSSAVRFETGTLELHLSNRVKNVGEGHERKLFGKAHINFDLSLGQIIKNIIFDEAEPEFQQYAFFHTTIALRNAFQDELLREDKELILLTLKRPLIYIQPVAVDKAILVWLNYKNAYEYWAEKRANLNYDLPVLDQNTYEKAAFGQLGNIAVSNLSMLFLQLTIEDLGLCLPLNPESWTSRSYQDFEAKGAVVITLEDIIISACNSGSLVSKGKFSGLCLRFADDFETTLDDWKPNMNEGCIMNLCVVSEGTCEVCSRTIATKKNENAKWFLNVKWQMEGVDIHLDTNIGKQLSSLGHTLTTLSGFEDDDLNTLESPDSENTDSNAQQKKHDLENLPAFLFDPRIDSKKRSIMMEREMTEQLKIINDLRTLGASHNTVSHEERRLQELQALCYKYFRRDIIQKWKRPSMRYSMINTSSKQPSFTSPSTITDIDEDGSNKKLEQSELSDLPTSLRSCDAWNNSLRSTKSAGRPTLSAALRQTSLPNTNFDSELTENDIVWASSDDLANNIVTPPDIKKKSQQKEPSIDFELDVKVLVNSGKCVLHTKRNNNEKDSSTGINIKYHKRERSIGNDWSSPLPSRKREKSKLRYNNPFPLDLTIFHIPGLDVKLQYQSTTVHDDSLNYLIPDNLDISAVSNRRMGNKRAFLSAWIILQSIPEETTISPHILQFLEETLEPISTKSESNITSATQGMNIDLLPDNYVVYASFPVDVIVYFHMQPSTFRFSCLPVSRVECMLQLPSLDIVFSSKRQDENDSTKSLEKNASGGLSVTGCLADFNVYIFHPYGGKKSGYKDAKLYPLNDAERKNSLSINVEFVKFHLNRRRKLYTDLISSKRVGNDSLSKAVIRFSTIVDIGSASFKYDMRRLTEILAFPKAWYRRRIMRRLFLGDLSGQTEIKPMQKKLNSDFNEHYNAANNIATTDKSNLRIAQFDASKIFLKPKNEVDNTGNEQNQAAAWETLVLFGINFTKLNVQMNMGNVMGNVVWLTKDFQSDGRLNIMSSGYKNMRIGIHLGGSSLDAKGGIVGGNFELSQIDKQIRIKEQVGLEPNHTVGLNLKALELRLDYMGTSVLMTRISSFSISMHDEWKTSETIRKLTKNAIIFFHSDVSWDQLQIMISKSTTADILKMYNKLEEFFSQQFKSSKRVFSILESKESDRNASLKKKHMRKKEKFTSEQNNIDSSNFNTEGSHHRHWQKPLALSKGLKLLSLSSSLLERENVLGGTVELRGSNISLACFHGINFKSKCWALFSLKEPCINYVTEARLINDTGDIKATQTLTFNLGETNKTPQNHSMAIVSRITRNVIFPPQFKNLHEWFQYAFANSEIDAVDRFPILEKEKEIATNSIERVRTSSSIPSKAQDHNHNREVIFALPSLQCHFKTEHKQGATIPLLTDEKPIVLCSFITEFDDHIFVTVDADAFFFLHDLITSYVKEKEKVIEAQNAKTTSPNISQVSKLSNGSTVVNGNNTTLNSTLQTQTSLEENKSLNTSQQQNGSKKMEQDLDLESFVRDWRHFECKTWHLEPTVRLLSWAGKSIEPYGIDYILNKLGFSHARTTIPKWMQRGFMDPFDKIQALLMTQLLALVKENKPNNEQP